MDIARLLYDRVVSLRRTGALASVAAAGLAFAALVFNSRAWSPGCTPHVSSARPVAQVLAVAALAMLLAVPVLCIAGLVRARLRRGPGDAGWAAVNVALFVVWWPAAYNAWILLGTIAHGGCDSS